MPTRPAYIDLDDARLLGQVARAHQLRPVARVARPAPPRTLLPIGVMLVTEAVVAATAAGPGKGKGRYCAVEYAADDTAKYGDPYGDAVPLYSIDTASGTPAGKKVIVGTLSGRPVVLVEVCP